MKHSPHVSRLTKQQTRSSSPTYLQEDKLNDSTMACHACQFLKGSSQVHT